MLKRWLLMAAILIVAGIAIWFGLPGAKTQIQVGDFAPAFTLPDLAGKKQQFPPKDSVILLNFWATWCPPCRKEMPTMATLYETLKTKGLRVVAVSVDRDAAALAGFVREYSLPFQVLHDQDSEVSRAYSVFRYPESFLIDRKGKIRKHWVGAVEWTSKSVMSEVKAILGETG